MPSIFDDNSRDNFADFFNPMLWVLIRIALVDAIYVAILMRAFNIGFKKEMTKIIFQLSSNIIK